MSSTFPPILWFAIPLVIVVAIALGILVSRHSE